MRLDAERVLDVRSSLGLTRREFADFLAVDVRSIYRWENGESRPSGTANAVLSVISYSIRTAPTATIGPAIAAVGDLARAGGVALIVAKLIDKLAGYERTPRTGPDEARDD